MTSNFMVVDALVFHTQRPIETIKRNMGWPKNAMKQQQRRELMLFLCFSRYSLQQAAAFAYVCT